MASTPMDSTRSYKAPKNLFSDGEFPMNSNNFPFRYETWSDTLFSSGEVSQYIKIEDVDEDSPTFGKSLYIQSKLVFFRSQYIDDHKK